MTLGRVCLTTAFALAVYAVYAGIHGARSGNRQWSASARHAMYAIAGLMVVAFATLEHAYITSDFTFGLVANNSSTTTPLFYKFTAIWSSQGGSLMLWVSVLALLSSAALYGTRNTHREVAPYANAVLGAIAVFFLGLMVFYPEANPFVASNPVPLEGNGLNPLLRHPSMMFHPPMLYAGYVGFSIPFAFAIGALVTRRLDASWIRSTRIFALLAWTFLSIGVLLGSRWSYSELGWGGYWGWDPVENASLLPWLTGTAFLHSIMVQERRGMLKVWNVCLITATFSLAILGTFLVRSGILDSIHAFGESTLGMPFLIFLLVILSGSSLLIVSRLSDLRSAHRLDSLLSREAMFLLNNLLLVALAATVFWGTFFPLISEAFTGSKASVGPPWFGQYVTPLAIVLVLVSGLGPVVPWRKMTPSRAWQAFRIPVAVAAVVTAVALFGFGSGSSIPATLMIFCATFAIVVALREFWLGARARQAVSGGSFFGGLRQLVTRNRRRYGGYIVHIGIAIMFIGVAVSSAFDHTSERTLKPGQTLSAGGYDFRYVRATSDAANERLSFGAILRVSKDGKYVATLHPARNWYPINSTRMGLVGRYFGGEATSEIGLKAGFTRDIWTAVQPDLRGLKAAIRAGNALPAIEKPEVQAIVITAIADSYPRRAGAATFRVIVNPLVTWLWIGGIVLLSGALLALWPSGSALRSRVSASTAARVAAGTAVPEGSKGA
ncbi:MAG: heme lyase CcmF/NrfE family subunit [Thermoleophilaceae bacterium]|nr:heme lyase CcmF/NrfE family subunit [Thermoleophilaceae bacterium]